MSRTAAALMLATLAACAAPAPKESAPAAPAPLSAADEAAVRAVDEAWAKAANAGDVAGLVAVYADDAILQGPDAAPVQGKEAITQALTALMAGKPSNVVLNTQKVEGRGDLAYMVGEFSMSMGGQTATGHYTEVLKKQADGSWKYQVDAYAMNAAAAPAAPAKK